MDLNQVVRRIQYQAAKIEVVEFLFWHGKNNQPSLETEMAYNMIHTLRQNLFAASEDCLDPSLEAAQSYIDSLQDTLVSATNFLIQMNSGFTSTEMQVVFLKELFVNIISELVDLNNELDNASSLVFQESPKEDKDNLMTVSQFLGLSREKARSDSMSPNSADSVIDIKLKNLINKCAGDVEKAERLIQYERHKFPELDRDGAIEFAITRYERDSQ